MHCSTSDRILNGDCANFSFLRLRSFNPTPARIGGVLSRTPWVLPSQGLDPRLAYMHIRLNPDGFISHPKPPQTAGIPPGFGPRLPPRGKKPRLISSPLVVSSRKKNKRARAAAAAAGGRSRRDELNLSRTVPPGWAVVDCGLALGQRWPGLLLQKTRSWNRDWGRNHEQHGGIPSPTLPLPFSYPWPSLP